MTKITYIPGEIANAAIDEHGNRKPVTRTHHIFDDTKDKNQAEINAEVDNTFAFHQSEINALNSQNYVTVDSFSSLPATGAVDTVYRVSNWDGTQQDPSVYSEYAWNGEDYVHLSTKTQIGEIFDISAYHATGGELAKYADLAAALNGGANIPQSLQKGGMSVKFVQSSDNKYVRYNLVATEFTTDVTKWAVDDNGVYVDDPEHTILWLDGEKKIIIEVQADGNIIFGAGVPPQVIEYVEGRIEDLSLDEYEDIVDFLGNLIEGDKTLAELLDEKVDKVEGKSLIDKDVADSIHYVENTDYINIDIDGNGNILESHENDGTKEFYTNVKISGKAILKETEIKEDVLVNGKTTIKDLEIDSEAIHIEQDENPEYIDVELDNEERIIAGRKSEGTKVENIGIETQRLLTNSLELTENGMSEFQQALKDSGFDVVGKCDWSDASAIEIPIPRYAQINISNADGTASWPTTKKDDLKYFMEFWDMQGNYFKKEIILNAQGNSTLAYEKKNGSIDICNNNGWDDEDTFSIKFGNWVPQDSFHLKAWYIDAFRGRANIAYELMTEIMNHRPYANQRPWHKLVEPDTTIYTGVGNIKYELNEEPLCVPDGFPCSVYLNGTFYGIYTFNLKKHRDNYALDKANKNNIHVDGDYYVTGVFGGTIDWQEMEIRNPKNLVYAEVHTDAKGKATFKYDADITNGQDEIAGVDKNYDGAWAAGSYAVGRVVLNNDNYFINQVADNTAEPILQDLSGNKNTAKEPDFKNKTGCGWINCTNTVHVKQKFQRLSGFHDAMVANPTKATFESYIDVDTCIDYLLHSNFLHNVDSINKNTQWVTYDGNIWYPFTYDCDQAFGLSTPGDHIRRYDYEYGNLDLIIGSDDLVDTTTNSPYPWIFTLYKNEIDARYKELVEAGILTVEHVVGMVIDYVKRVGLANYKKELNKWPATPSYRDATQYDNKGFYESVMRVQKYLTAQKAELDNYFNLDI